MGWDSKFTTYCLKNRYHLHGLFLGVYSQSSLLPELNSIISICELLTFPKVENLLLSSVLYKHDLLMRGYCKITIFLKGKGVKSIVSCSLYHRKSKSR